MRPAVLILALCLALPAQAFAQADGEARNAPATDADQGGELYDAPLNTSDGMTGDDYQEEDLSQGVGTKPNQRQCVALARLLMQQQTTVEVQQSLRARGCQ